MLSVCCLENVPNGLFWSFRLNAFNALLRLKFSQYIFEFEFSLPLYFYFPWMLETPTKNLLQYFKHSIVLYCTTVGTVYCTYYGFCSLVLGFLDWIILSNNILAVFYSTDGFHRLIENYSTSKNNNNNLP